MSKRKICVVTGTRAEYSLLYWLMKYIKNDPELELQIIATGMHLSDRYGLTYKQIENDGFKIDSKIDISLTSDSSKGILKSMGIGLSKFPNTYNKLKPNLIVLLGDRFEIFCASTAAMISCIPIAHLHGGEATEGLIDEPIRHSITKMSHLHFVANEEYRKRVIQLGENPDNVFCVGGIGIDNILKLELLSKHKLEEELNFKFNRRNFLITFHPVTLERNTAKKQINELLLALDSLEDTNFIFTMPNADTDGQIIFKMINKFVEKRRNSKSFTSLGQLNYLSCIKYVDGVIGNSSSGLLEVPTFKKGTINIGDRQRGRIMADSVINCSPTKESILKAIEEIYSPVFNKRLREVINPYGQGGASRAIIDKIKTISLQDILKKKFYDWEIK